MAENASRAYYAIIPANVRYDSNLMPSAKLLYGEITALCNEKGYCWASDRYFAELYGVSKTTIQNWMKNLSDRKYITREVVYKEGTKEILRRYTRLFVYPIQENLHTPIQENLRDNNTSFNNTLNNTKDIKNSVEQSSSRSEYFEEFWKSYPKKTQKKKAKEQFVKKIKSDADLETFEQGFNAYLKYIEINEWYHPQELFRWIRDERYNDEYDLTPPKQQGFKKQPVRQEVLPDWAVNKPKKNCLSETEKKTLKKELAQLLQSGAEKKEGRAYEIKSILDIDEFGEVRLFPEEQARLEEMLKNI